MENQTYLMFLFGLGEKWKKERKRDDVHKNVRRKVNFLGCLHLV